MGKPARVSVVLILMAAVPVPASWLLFPRKPSPPHSSDLHPQHPRPSTLVVAPETYLPPTLSELPGWTTSSTGPVDIESSDVPATVAATIPLADEDSPAGIPIETLKLLPPDGIVIYVGIVLPEQAPATPNTVFFTRTLPLLVSDADVQPNWEGQASPNVPQYMIVAVVNEQYVEARVFFGRLDPRPQQLMNAQAELATLSVPSPPAG
jgi:hypothetical protein